ncbi:MAG TPA: S41 family peptidase [Flavobacteriales bacterium]|nr:S41 family peptidase [Flavobacteriales bacterium]HIO60111.1 S41 family peptidase [Flavobacteriales bacterium]
MSENDKKSIFKGPTGPLIFALTLAAGLMLGRGCDDVSHRKTFMGSRISHILDQIEVLYVDSVDREALVDVAVDAIINELDPHTYYFTQEEIDANAESMEGNFEGIGVEFIIKDDSLMVVSVIEGGPSEKAGVLDGDRIVEVGEVEVSQEKLDNKRVMKLLKGERGTRVELGLVRSGSFEHVNVEIERDRIPIYSVVASFVLENEVGYIKINRFSATTAIEFEKAMNEIELEGVNSLIIDLRSNGGGYLNPAVDMIDLFLNKDEEILYTEGNAVARKNYLSRVDGEYKDWPLAIIIDENSASASEIFAGAMQDNDRAIILGRRSFGKGLVQEEYDVPGAGALRLTIARFYTPSGRAIQKPYGKDVNYEHDQIDRFDSGELYFEDSIKVADTVIFRTKLGRPVFGGGGITPDIFIPINNPGSNVVLSELVWTGAIRDAAFSWIDLHRNELPDNLSESSKIWMDINKGGKATIKRVVAEMEMVWPESSTEEGREGIERIMNRFYAQVIRIVEDDNGFYRALYEGDDAIERALYELLEERRFGSRDGRLYLLPEIEPNQSDSLSQTLNIN